MKETLQLHEIVGYLPYGLKMSRLNKDNNPVLIEMNNGNIMYPIEHPERCKVILRPMSESELTKTILTDMGQCTILDYISTSKKDSQLNARLLLSDKYDQLEHWKITRLLQMHFDIHNLIGRGLAIDKNTLKD